MIAAYLCALVAIQEAEAVLNVAVSADLTAQAEAEYYSVDYLQPPDGARLEVGGMGFMPDGRLAISTRRGQVWMVENALAENPEEARFTLFAEGLWEGLGLSVHDGELYVLQRAELSRLSDMDGDGRCDTIDTISDSWGLSGHYHEFAFGLPVDDAGRFYMSLNVSFGNPMWWHGQSAAPYRGWILRVDPSGAITPIASGARSPCGLGFNSTGDLFYTDNQGDWMPACPIFHVREGDFFGHPASLRWTPEYLASKTEVSDTIPPARADSDRARAAVWLPYKWSRSTGNLVNDGTSGAFGPFGDQMFVAELTNGMVLRTQMERVQGEYQGAAFLFRQNIGSVARVAFAPDGTLFCGMTNRGWGGREPADGLARIRWTGETPFEMHSAYLQQDGFEIAFTKPLAEGALVDPSSIRLTQYDYDYWWEYGSPERATTDVPVTGATVSPDRMRLTLSGAELVAGKVARCVLPPLVAEDGTALLHDEFNYTINELPEGPVSGARIAKIVPPPPAHTSQEEGWLRLTYGDATDRWNFRGWELCGAELDADNPKQFVTEPGNSALVNSAASDPTDYVSKPEFGDCEVHLEFMLPEGGDSGLLLQGRYELRLTDSSSRTELTAEHCGGVTGAENSRGVAPKNHPYYGAGNWHDLDLEFRAARFDAAGNKLENAQLVAVSIDDILIHSNLELSEPSRSALFPGEVAEGPLAIVGTRSPVAIGNIRVSAKRGAEPEDDRPWNRLFKEDSDLDAWTAIGDAYWTLEDGELLAEGPRGYLLSPKADFRNFELRARVKISDGGNAGLVLRAAVEDGVTRGYEAEINSSFPDPQRTGSLRDLAPVTTQLVSENTWFDYRVNCREEPEGTRIRIAINNVLITDYLDREHLFESGHIAIEQNHEGSVLELKDLRWRD